MIIHTQTIRGLMRTICLGVFDHFVRLAIKGLMVVMKKNLRNIQTTEVSYLIGMIQNKRTSHFLYVIRAPGAYLISKLQVAALTEVRHLKEGGAYVNVR